MESIQQFQVDFEIDRGIFKTQSALWWRDHIKERGENLRHDFTPEINKILLDGFIRSVDIAYDAILDVLCTKTYLEYTKLYILNQMLDFANETFLKVGREDLCWIKVEVEVEVEVEV